MSCHLEPVGCSRLPQPTPTLGFSLGEQVPKSLWIAAAVTGRRRARPRIAQLIGQYCVTCHNQRLKTAGLALDTLDPAKIPADARLGKKCFGSCVRAPCLPPECRARMRSLVRVSFRRSKRGSITLRSAKPYAGRPLLHRMNRAEYANAIRDLLALDVDARRSAAS